MLEVGGADNVRKEAEDLPNLENFVQLRLIVLLYVEMVMPASWNAAASSNYWYRCPHAIAMTIVLPPSDQWHSCCSDRVSCALCLVVPPTSYVLLLQDRTLLSRRYIMSLTIPSFISSPSSSSSHLLLSLQPAHPPSSHPPPPSALTPPCHQPAHSNPLSHPATQPYASPAAPNSLLTSQPPPPL